jgi:hypothetical protein
MFSKIAVLVHPKIYLTPPIWHHFNTLNTAEKEVILAIYIYSKLHAASASIS